MPALHESENRPGAMRVRAVLHKDRREIKQKEDQDNEVRRTNLRGRLQAPEIKFSVMDSSFPWYSFCSKLHVVIFFYVSRLAWLESFVVKDRREIKQKEDQANEGRRTNLRGRLQAPEIKFSVRDSSFPWYSFCSKLHFLIFSYVARLPSWESVVFSARLLERAHQ
jgi:hypothetical protein